MLCWLYILHFPGGWGKGETPKSASDLTPAFFYFLLSLSKCAYAGNKRHVSSLEKLITGLWSPDIMYGQGKQKRELVEDTQNILLSSPRELDGQSWQHFIQFLLFLCSSTEITLVCFVSIFCSKAIWLSIWRRVCDVVWFLRTLI